ncbi:archaellin/type IV pilin N-terminal domain-containing protein [Halogeometricum sp. CBA1124]|uniref:DUF7289 family protein n=1 Tax=Halogeometricum sp. CBA1124 TaxID=2668071 RepID=UPI001E622DB9|nr:archaellin/type IV pilin N-terminal domain-containing protein [Halogeometricum sp. CBA1124]
MTAEGSRSDRAQSAVVGVAILLGLTVVGVGVLTAAAGTAIQEGASTAATARVADGLDDALDAGTAAEGDATVRLAGGTIRVADRRVRVLNDSGVVWTAAAGGLVYESGDRRVSAVAGASPSAREPKADWTRRRVSRPRTGRCTSASPS